MQPADEFGIVGHAFRFSFGELFEFGFGLVLVRLEFLKLEMIPGFLVRVPVGRVLGAGKRRAVGVAV
jgi:hypothetical protein